MSRQPGWNPVARSVTVSGLAGRSVGGSVALKPPGATSFGVDGWKSAARSWMCPRPTPSSHWPPPYAPISRASQ